MKVLFLHGWLHTHNMFKKYEDVYDCTFFEINGLTNNVKADFYNNLLRLKILLEAENFDLIVCHSLGATLLQDCFESIGDATVIMYSPLSGNLSVLGHQLLNVSTWLPKVRGIIKSKKLVSWAYSKILSEKDKDILDVAIEGYYVCNPRSAAKMIKQAYRLLPKRGVTLPNKCYLIYGRKDKLTEVNYEAMAKVFPDFKMTKLDCGHITPMYMSIDDVLNLED